MEIKSATVAGCAGVVGRSLVEQLTKNGTRVVGFCRSGKEQSMEDLKIKSKGLFEVISGDMTTLAGSSQLVSKALGKLDGIISAHFHAAG